MPNSLDIADISLEQALIDVEIANARVIDLSKRLKSLSEELSQSRALPKTGAPDDSSTVDALKSELYKARAQIQALKIRNLQLAARG